MVFDPFLTPSIWFFGLGLFQNMFHNLLIYTHNFDFGYITVSCFLETFPGGWVVGKSDSNETPVVSLDFDLEFGLRLKGILSPRGILTYMMYFNPLIMKNIFFFSHNVIFYPKFDFSHLILPNSRTSCQEKSATNLSGKKCYCSQNLSVKYRYLSNLVRKKVLLQRKLIRKNVLFAQTCQEKCATQLKQRQVKMLLDLNSIKSIKNLSND